VPKIIGASLAEHRANVLTRLFEALSELMSESGFAAVSLADVAARAGVGRTSVYNYFSDKEALLLGFIEHETETFVHRLHAALEHVTDPQQQLRIYVREHVNLERSFHLPPGPDLRSVVSPETARRLRHHVVQVEDTLRRILSDAVGAGMLPAQDVESVVPLINACLMGPALSASGPGRDRAIAAAEAFIMRAVGVPEHVVTADEVALGA